MSTQQYDPTGAGIVDALAAFFVAELPDNANSGALANRVLASSGRSYLIQFTVANTNVAAQFIQLHDATSSPANGAVPQATFTAPGSGDKTVAYTLPGRYFSRGIWVCNSSTSATLTAGAADCYIDVQYIPVVWM